MGKDLYDLANEKGIEVDEGWVKIAFNQILGSIYYSMQEESELDTIIEKMAVIVKEKLGISEDELDWQQIEEWHFTAAYNLVTYDYYIDFDEAKKIICKAKVLSDDDWEIISSDAMNINQINQKMIESFEHHIDDYYGVYKEEFRDQLKVKSSSKT